MLAAVHRHINEHQTMITHLFQRFGQLRLQLLRLADADPDVAIGFRKPDEIRERLNIRL